MVVQASPAWAINCTITKKKPIHEDGFLFYKGSAHCPGADDTDIRVVLQVFRDGAWRKKADVEDDGITFAAASGFAPCSNGNRKYRTKVVWQALIYAFTPSSQTSQDTVDVDESAPVHPDEESDEIMAGSSGVAHTKAKTIYCP